MYLPSRARLWGCLQDDKGGLLAVLIDFGLDSLVLHDSITPPEVRGGAGTIPPLRTDPYASDSRCQPTKDPPLLKNLDCEPWQGKSCPTRHLTWVTVY